jgi:hypothetical protein
VTSILSPSRSTLTECFVRVTVNSTSHSSLPPGALPSCSNCVLHDRPFELANTCLGRLHLPTVLPLPDLAHTFANPATTSPTTFCSFLDMAPSGAGQRKRKRADQDKGEPFSLDAYIASLPDARRAPSSSRSLDAGGDVKKIKQQSDSTGPD